MGDSRSGRQLWIKIARTIVSVVVRTLLALAALAIVTAIPSFGLFMGVIGATCSFSLAVTLPSLYYVRLFWGSLTPFKRLAHCALVAFGILSSVMGTYASIQRHAHASPSEG
jgi:amino acid permease